MIGENGNRGNIWHGAESIIEGGGKLRNSPWLTTSIAGREGSVRWKQLAVVRLRYLSLLGLRSAH